MTRLMKERTVMLENQTNVRIIDPFVNETNALFMLASCLFGVNIKVVQV